MSPSQASGQASKPPGKPGHPRTIGRRLRWHAVLALLLAAVLLAAYVSVGRQFMPAIANYTGFFEDQIEAITGVPVRVESLRGGFSGFNPVIEVNGLSMLMAPGSDPAGDRAGALDFDRGRVAVDMIRSIVQRRWVLAEFVVERLELELSQTADGAWLLGDIAMPSGGGVDPDTVYRALLDVSQLDLREVVVNVRTRSGERLRFIDGAARIQNRNGNHFLHVDINPEGQNRRLALSLEVRGGNLSAISGSLHAAVPAGDYSYLLGGQEIAGYRVETLAGGGDIWIDFERGAVRRIVADARVDALALRTAAGAPVMLTELGGALEARVDGEATSYSFAGLRFSHAGAQWPPGDLHLRHVPESSLSLRAGRADLAILAALASAFDLLPDAARDALEQARPAGMMENLALNARLDETGGRELGLQANIDGVAIASLRNAPAMSGLTGYLEVSADLAAARASGLVEIDSGDFTMNIPRVYSATWAFDEMNGSLAFDFDYSDGLNLRLGSSVLVGRSAGVDSRVRFTSELDQRPDGERENELELLVGVLRMEAAESGPFLPDGPGITGGLRDGMAFLDGALAAGELRNSGGIYRGSTVRGANRLSRTFQSFHQWLDGNLRFDPEWPEVASSRALVLSDDNAIDVLMEDANSRGLASSLVRGGLRPDDSGASVLSVSGRVAGAAADGLAWLHASPAAARLRAASADWRIDGQTQGGFALEMPLGQAASETRLRLDFALDDSDLWVAQYDLALSGLNGALVFDTASGIERGDFAAKAFGGDAGIEVSSRGPPGDMEQIVVVAKGRAERRELRQWPRQSALVRGLLDNARGSFLYAAELHIEQGGSGASSLRLASDLAGLFLDLPEPFAKQAGEPLPLTLQIDRADDRQRITGGLGGRLRFDLESSADAAQRGWMRVGSPGRRRVEAEASRGVAVYGGIDRLALEEWSSLFAGLRAASPSPAGMREALASVSLDVGEIDVYGQTLADVRMEVEPVADGLRAVVSGDSAQGSVVVPLAGNEPLLIDLDYLRFQGPKTPPAAGPGGAGEAPDVDLLARVDPRKLPRTRVSINEVRIGDTPWGGWRFSLEPDADGADFADLGFDFRGFRMTAADAGDSQPPPVPGMRWDYDGRGHATRFRGRVLAGDIAVFLLDSGFAASVESESAGFEADVRWPGTPVFFRARHLSGGIGMRIENGRFLETTAGGGTLKLISIINLDAIMRRLRLSDDLLRRGLAFDEITGRLNMENGLARIEDQLVISGPSSLYQITGEVDFRDETIAGEMYVTLPVSDNIPWIGLITGNLPLALGAYLFDQIFGDQVDSLTSAVYTLEGPWEGLEPEFKQAFGTPGED